MRLEIHTFNNKREVNIFINEKGLRKEDILSFFQEKDGTYTLMYYVE